MHCMLICRAKLGTAWLVSDTSGTTRQAKGIRRKRKRCVFKSFFAGKIRLKSSAVGPAGGINHRRTGRIPNSPPCRYGVFAAWACQSKAATARCHPMRRNWSVSEIGNCANYADDDGCQRRRRIRPHIAGALLSAFSADGHITKTHSALRRAYPDPNQSAARISS